MMWGQCGSYKKNRIDDDINITFDVPSANSDNMVPVLDLKIRINEQGMAEHVFYRKPMASCLLTHKESALSNKAKFTILTQECFRRVHNTSDHVDVNTKVKILNEYMRNLKASGYNEKERENILLGGIMTFSKLKQKEREGLRPFYRPPGFEKEQSRINK